ncbi:MAG: aldehyde dehydrogenase family protein, partial [Pseudomonadota bacterium]
MQQHLKFYIGGEWVDPAAPATIDVVNPATEETFAQISNGSAADVDKAVAAARAAFPSFSETTKQERLDLLGSILGVFAQRKGDVADAISSEMG